MPIIEWSKSFELGIDEFDYHHKHLVDLLNMTYDRFTNGASHEELGAVLDELADYATYHFAAEEYWMGVHEYPGFTKHSEEHKKFCNRVTEILNDFHNGNDSLSLEVLTFIMNWLTHHIMGTDAMYGVFAKGLPHVIN